MPTFYTAEICMNGHITTGNIEHNPERRETYCHICGAPTITECPSCHASIRGDYDLADGDDIFSLRVPLRLTQPLAYCTKCGHPFPWTNSALSAAKELIQMSNLSISDIDFFNKNIDKILYESPSSTVAIVKIKKILEKVGKFSIDIIKQTLISVASETAKRILWP
ncbi:DUF2321 domain-containing protein [Megasphaera sp.]|mgnify:FL=1|uniref:DUF2321 domain-containing protein n=1 Tax=Megasphaera sp. TaxID=2023260 RepID=UPI003522043B